MSGKLRVWALGAMAAVILEGCGGGEAVGTAPEDRTSAKTEAPGDGGGAAGEDRVTIEANGTTVTIERLGGASFLNLQTGRAGHAAIRTGTCGSRGEVVSDLGEFSTLLASEVAIDFDELTGGSYVLMIDDSFCVELQQK